LLYYGPARGHLRVLKAMREPTKDHPVVLALSAVLASEEPELIRWLRSLWDKQSNDITYGQIRDAILDGTLSVDFLKQWQQDYTELIVEKMAPRWRDAMQDAAEAQPVHKRGFVFDPGAQAVNDWIEQHGTELAVNLSETQHRGLQAVIQQAANGAFGPDELARVIRPLIGMAPRNMKACERYYEGLRKEGMRANEALKRAMNYAATAHRARAQSIARTELVSAFNRGAHESILQAQQQGYISKVKKRWLTAEDERVCDVCGPMDGIAVGQDEDFPGGYDLPGAHPMCRCVVVYEEVDSR
jgi:SPP1 gp7 family putative phage head morphogenesis protein